MIKIYGQLVNRVDGLNFFIINNILKVVNNDLEEQKYEHELWITPHITHIRVFKSPPNKNDFAWVYFGEYPQPLKFTTKLKNEYKNAYNLVKKGEYIYFVPKTLADMPPLNLPADACPYRTAHLNAHLILLALMNIGMIADIRAIICRQYMLSAKDDIGQYREFLL
jgi:hypothetical protein